MRSLWSNGRLTQHAVPRDLLQIEHVFQKEKSCGFQQLRQLNRLERRKMLLSVVEKLGFETNLAADVLEELGNCFNVEILIENAARRSPNRPFPFTGLDESSPSVPAELDADVRETALHR